MAAEYRRTRVGRAATLSRDTERALTRHRERIAARHAVKTADALVRMVDALGFCFAFTGESAYPIPAAFDHLDTRSDGRKWEWMWGWKDELAEEKRLYYGKLLVRKPTFVSMRMLPTFYATFGRAGEADDHLEDVRAGRLSEIARRIIEFLAVNGETQTKRMRSALGITSQEGKSDYAKAIEELQRLMYVARVRAVGEGREDYNYTYDLFVHRYPETVRAAERASSAEAMTALLAHLLDLAGGVTERQVSKLFDWSEDRVAHAARRLETKNAVVRADGLLVLPTLG
jgi:DNA-binding Lrp family transcriptional regulator